MLVARFANRTIVRRTALPKGGNRMTNKIFNAAFIVLIVFVGLVAAYILFAVLDSKASGNYQGYSVTGAAAGFVVVELLLFSAYQQLRKSDREDLQKQIDQLQQKLIRGAPHPVKFEIEVAERERLVLARPQGWKPGTGIIFDFQPPREDFQSDYEVSPEFRCSYTPISESSGPTKIPWWQHRNARSTTTDSGKQFYENYRQERLGENKDNSDYEMFSCEYDYIGGESEPVECLRVITHEYIEVTPHEPDPATRVKLPPRWRPITREHYERLPKFKAETPDSVIATIISKSPIKKKKSSGAVATEPGTPSDPAADGEREQEIPQSLIDSMNMTTNGRSRSGAMVVHASLICYHEQLGKVYYFEFWAAPDDFIQGSAKFNQILNSVRFL